MKRVFKLFSSDLDGTLIGQSDLVVRFTQAWDKLANGLLLCYNTGRLLDDALQTVNQTGLPVPDFIISGIGTSIYDGGEKKVIKEFSQILEEGWNLEAVEKVVSRLDHDVVRQPDHFQHPYKSSWYLDHATDSLLKTIRIQLEQEGVLASVVYSSGHYLDILPMYANKGNALQWLLKKIKVKASQCIVAGDSGNDLAMFTLDGVKGIVVGNAQMELYEATKHLPHYHAEGGFAEGVCEGLVHYKIFDSAILRTQASVKPDSRVAPITDSTSESLTQEQLAFVRQGYKKAIAALRKNITSDGFSACSLTDNKAHGTDVNYRSVWARDGSIAVIGSLSLRDDEEIRKCQKATFDTLLAHITPNGQIPTNVSIDLKKPDYSGVGGITSIDSMLWVIIAFYHYVAATKDLQFLREHIVALQRAMTWLSAHDGNNDALLEIPEAGDWTDLFGRSYNVLYDEVLWFRANICFGRMLELLGDDQRAGDYLRWSLVIKKEILRNFWPSTTRATPDRIDFADQQFSLGDARYLLAQITPFDFSWRCDVYGNILAFLFDVVDADKARQAFRFMWGSGVNEPFPVVNLYPVVSEGDKDWRRYYIVNLLNLPHHYHNGGVWPFIGAMWVRFLHKLGLTNLAAQEIYRVAKLNHQGIEEEWEFTEWAHGETGRPMGKSYQAWSASEYILACHHLKLDVKG